MSKLYLLPCPCGEQTAIEIGQAGQRIACSHCGKPLDAPTMRGIRQLPAAAELSTDRRRDMPTWTHLQGILFASGLAVALVAFPLAGFFFYSRMQLNTVRPEVTDEALFNRNIDELPLTGDTPANVWEIWTHIENDGLGEWHEPAYLQHRKSARVIEIVFVICLVAGTGGVILAIGACLIRAKTISGPQ